MSFQRALERIKQLTISVLHRCLPKVASPKSTPHKDPADVSRMLGLALQGQGQLDLAFEQFRHAQPNPAVLQDLRGLALEFERKQQFSQAEGVLRYMASCQADDREIQTLLKRLTARTTATSVQADGPSHAMLGQYQVGKELGKGAMGVVYLGQDTQSGRVVALKTMALSEEFEGRDLADARERFFREAEAAGRLQHPTIVTIYGASEDQGLAYIAMEFVKGKDLLDFCKPGSLLPVSSVISIVARVAEALAYAHRLNVVHRDIKPANIMYEMESDTVKVTDFGIARITDSSKTKTGLVLGTPSFMSPEQLVGSKVDGRSDLYSLGVMLFQMLSGVLPFRGASMAELMNKISTVDAPEIRHSRPDLSPDLASLVAFSLRKRPEDRYQDGDQFAAALRAVLSGASPIDLEI